METSLTKRQWLGLIWEITTQLRLTGIVDFIGNPTDGRWTSHIGYGSDIKIPSLDIEVECKYGNYIVYPCHIESCYIPRFKRYTKHKWTCTNDKSKYTLAARDTLDEENIKLLYPFEIEARIFRMLFDNMKGYNYVKSTSLVKDNTMKLLGSFELVILQEFINQFREVRRRLMLISRYLCLDTLDLTSTMLYMKHCLRIKSKRFGPLEYPPTQAKNNNTSSALWSITPYFSINASSFEFYPNSTSGVPWIQEYMHRLN